MATKYKQIITLAVCVLVLANCHRLSKRPLRSSQVISYHKTALKSSIDDTCFPTHHVSYLLVDGVTGKRIQALNEDMYFTPASVTKLMTSDLALHVIQDSIMRFSYIIKNDTLCIRPYGDPTWYHPDFETDFSFFDSLKMQYPLLRYFYIYLPKEKIKPYAHGWSYEDFNETFFKPISIVSIAGNEEKVFIKNNEIDTPCIFLDAPIIPFTKTTNPLHQQTYLYRDHFSNQLFQRQDTCIISASKVLPIYTDDSSLVKMLAHKSGYRFEIIHDENINWFMDSWTKKKFVPLDTVIKKMLVASDNFLADQLLLQSSLLLHIGLNVDSIYNFMAATYWKNIPQKTYWFDGSGLSRYNATTAQNLVYILQDLIKERGSIETMQSLLAKAGEGTLSTWRNSEFKNNLFAKTGSMRGIYNLVGILHTQKKKPILFAIMVEGSPIENIDCLKLTLLRWYYHL